MIVRSKHRYKSFSSGVVCKPFRAPFFTGALQFLFAAVLLLPASSQARSVSYPGGWTLSTMNDSDAYTVLGHYSPTARHALGLRMEHRRDTDVTLSALQSNILVKRWNGRDSQANLYFKGGVGSTSADTMPFGAQTEPAGFAGTAADWEDRRYFVSYANRGLYAGDHGKTFSQRARLGFAPYVGDYGDLHTWLMVEFQHFPQRDRHVRIAPLVRLFKGVGLLEAGIDSEGDALFNLTYRF